MASCCAGLPAVPATPLLLESAVTPVSPWPATPGRFPLLPYRFVPAPRRPARRAVARRKRSTAGAAPERLPVAGAPRRMVWIQGPAEPPATLLLPVLLAPWRPFRGWRTNHDRAPPAGARLASPPQA